MDKIHRTLTRSYRSRIIKINIYTDAFVLSRWMFLLERKTNRFSHEGHGTFPDLAVIRRRPVCGAKSRSRC